MIPDFDYAGDLTPFQDRLDAAGVDFDVSMLCGATKSQIEGVVNRLLAVHAEVRESGVMAG